MLPSTHRSRRLRLSDCTGAVNQSIASGGSAAANSRSDLQGLTNKKDAPASLLGHHGVVPTAPISRLVAARVAELQRFVGRHPAIALTLAALLALALGMTAAAASIYDAVTESEGVAGLDQPVLEFAVAHRNPGLDDAVTTFTDLGGSTYSPVIAAVSAAAIAVAWRRWTPLVLMALATLGSVLMTVVGKAVVGRVRPPAELAVPPLESSFSFPSGHTLNTLVVAGVVAYLLIERCSTRWMRLALLVFAGGYAAAMGLSRVFLGHHWLTDVLVAWALGLAWLAIVITGHRVWLLRTGHHPKAVDAA